MQQAAPVSYKVCDLMDTVYCRHGDQLRSRSVSSNTAMHDKETVQNHELDCNVQDSGVGETLASACETLEPLLEPQVASPVGFRHLINVL